MGLEGACAGKAWGEDAASAELGSMSSHLSRLEEGRIPGVVVPEAEVTEQRSHRNERPQYPWDPMLSRKAGVRASWGREDVGCLPTERRKVSKGKRPYLKVKMLGFLLGLWEARTS